MEMTLIRPGSRRLILVTGIPGAALACQPANNVELVNASSSPVKVWFHHSKDAVEPYVASERLDLRATARATLPTFEGDGRCDARGFLRAVADDGRTAQFGPPLCARQVFRLAESQLRIP